jgi:hypothetical protein
LIHIFISNLLAYIIQKILMFLLLFIELFK